MDIKQLPDELRKKSEYISDIADFMDAHHQTEMSAWYRHAQACVLRIMDVIEAEKYEEIVDVEELLEEMIADARENAFMFHNKGYEKFAELAKIESCVIASIQEDIERNK